MRDFSLKKIYLASPRGFCAGVKRAVEIVDLVIKKHRKPVYIRHQIVHNQHITKSFEKRGAIFVEDIKQIPDGSVVVFSAHGSHPDLYKIARSKNLKVYDAVCPLVTKVHLEIKKYYKEGYFTLYIGHRGHPEPVGVLGEIPSSVSVLIENLSQAKELFFPKNKKLVVLNQTTLSLDETKDIFQYLKKKFPWIVLPPTMDICYATQNRQNAVKLLAKKADLVLVVGSKKSSNSTRLKDLGQKLGVKSYLVDDETQVENKWLKNVKYLGITAGASVPSEIIDRVVNYFAKGKVKVEEVIAAEEKVNFPIIKI